MKGDRYLLILLFFIFALYAEAKIGNIKIHRINSINFNYKDNSDLKCLDTLLRNKKMVILGEKDHYAGLISSAKSRVIKYLHEKLGYDVIIFEDSFYSKYREWLSLLDTNNIRKKYTFCYSSWGLGLGVYTNYYSYDLENYITNSATTNHPLYMSGLDIGYGNSHFTDYFLYDIQKILQTNRPDYLTSESWKRFVTYDYLCRKINVGNNIITKSALADYKQISDSIVSIIRLNKSKDVLYDNFLIQAIHSNFYAMYWSVYRPSRKLVTKYCSEHVYHEIRDSLMYENLMWLINNLYPNKKIIVDVSNYHTSNQFSGWIDKKFNYYLGKPDVKPMRAYLTDSSIYTIAFIYNTGKLGGDAVKYDVKLRPKPPATLEAKMRRHHVKYGFVDLSNQDQKKFKMAPIFEKSFKGKWSKIYNGVFYIDKMKPTRQKWFKEAVVEHDKYRFPVERYTIDSIPKK